MKKSIKQTISTVLVIFGLLVVSNMHAQGPPSFPGSGGNGDDIEDETPPAPINGLLLAGLVAGSALGYKKLKK